MNRCACGATDRSITHTDGGMFYICDGCGRQSKVYLSEAHLLKEQLATSKEANRQLQALVWDLQNELHRKCFECPVKKQNAKLMGYGQNLNQAPGETGHDYVARLLREARRDE